MTEETKKQEPKIGHAEIVATIKVLGISKEDEVVRFIHNRMVDLNMLDALVADLEKVLPSSVMGAVLDYAMVHNRAVNLIVGALRDHRASTDTYAWGCIAVVLRTTILYVLAEAERLNLAVEALGDKAPKDTKLKYLLRLIAGPEEED